MAAAEARTAWQRMANRCFVQEDAKRAPKFACCPSSLSKLQSDSSSEDATHEKDHPPLNFAHVNWNPANFNFSPDTKWWLQVQPNLGHQELTGEQLHLLEGKLEDKSEVRASPTSKSEDNIDLDIEKNGSVLLEPPRIMPTKLVRHNSETKIEGLKAATSSPDFHKYKLNFQENLHDPAELRSWKAADQIISVNKENTCFDLAPTWAGGEKTEPWWKIADREELKSLVAKKSLEHFDNCDLPPPQKIRISRCTLPCFEKIEDDGRLPSYYGDNLNARTCIPSKHSLHCFSGSLERTHPLSFEHPFSEMSALQSYDHPITVGINDKKEKLCPPSDPSKAELLEALCHSQTRARKAEIAAEKAHSEKEHIIKLFFRQASHLFAYKQWLQLLQLERLYLQLKFREQDIPNLPWAATEDDYSRDCKDEEKKAKEQHTCSICGFLVAFAVRFSLASAGLLLGWTLGCLLPV